MIRFLLPQTILLLLSLLCGCTAGGTPNPTNRITSIAMDEVEGVPPAQEFARLCLAQNKSIAQLVEFAMSDGWQNADDDILNNAGLPNLRRQVLEIPGGGGQYRETQSILNNQSEEDALIANLMQRFDRKDALIRTECTLYAREKNHLPICTAIGDLLKRPPDSNQRFKQTASQFIRWNITISDRPASVRCEGIGTGANSQGGSRERFTGTIISMIVDQANVVKPISSLRKNSGPQDR